MAENDITITVDADNRTTAAFGAAARGARTVGEATENANRALREAANRSETAALRLRQLAAAQQAAQERAQRLARETDDLRRAIAATGTATAQQTDRLARLTREQDQARTSARLLALQHSRSTDEVNDLARAYQRAERNAQQALRASLMFGAGARLGPDGSVGAGGSGRGDGGPSGIMALLATLPGLGGFIARASSSGAAAGAGGAAGNPLVGAGVVAAGAAAAAVLAPLIGGAISGALGAAGGIGGVALGVSGAIANDPDEFRARWDKVVQDVTGRWVKASASWMEPVKGSINEVDQMLKRLPIESILSDSAAYLEPLTKGATGFGTNLASGIASLIKDVGPVIDMLGKRLPQLGSDFGQFFAAIGKGSEGGAEALDDVLAAVGRLTRGLGVTLSALGTMYKGIKDGAAAIGDLAGSSADWVANLLDGVPVLDSISKKIKEFRSEQGDVEISAVRFRGSDAAVAFQQVKQSAEEAAKAIKDYLDRLREARDVAAANASANVALAQGWLDLKDQLKDGKRTLDLNTQAGIDNASMLIQQAANAESARQAQLALTGDVDASNAAYNANIERIRQMAYALGFNKREVDALIESLRTLAVQNSQPKVELVGAQLAMSQGIALGALLNNIAHTYTAKVQVVTGPGISLGNALHHAIGGPTSPGPSVINEWGGQSGIGGGEVVSLPSGSMVYGGAAASGGGQSGGGGGQGGGTMTAQLVLSSDGNRLTDLLIDTIAVAMRARGGDPSQLGLRMA